MAQHQVYNIKRGRVSYYTINSALYMGGNLCNNIQRFHSLFSQELLCTYTAKFKTEVINSSFLNSDIATSVRTHPACMFQCVLPGTHNVQSKISISCQLVLNFVVYELCTRL